MMAHQSTQQESILSARNLSKEYVTRGDGAVFAGKNRFMAVDDVSFDVPTGKTLGIVGESGSGKSTTARIVAKLLDPTSGTMQFEGVDVTRASGRALAAFRSRVQVVFQDPFSSLNPRHTIENIIAAPLDYQGIKPPEGRRALVRDLLDRVGLNPDHLQRYPAQFSGGQAQRIGIARALAVDPKLVICDEAVSALDVSVQAQILDLLAAMQQRLGFALLFITHDLRVASSLCDRIAVMQSGRIVEAAEPALLFASPREAYTRALLASVPGRDWHPQADGPRDE
jgi:peptide/nickel transport system ATP-binding protein